VHPSNACLDLVRKGNGNRLPFRGESKGSAEQREGRERGEGGETSQFQPQRATDCVPVLQIWSFIVTYVVCSALQGGAIIGAVAVVTMVTAVQNFQKEKQFRQLNSINEDIKVRVHDSPRGR
jgi:hypothetical protein